MFPLNASAPNKNEQIFSKICECTDQLSEKVAFRRKVHVRFPYRTGSPESRSLESVTLYLVHTKFSLRKLGVSKIE